MGGWSDRDTDEAEAAPSANLPAPWEQDDYAAAPADAPVRPRHVAFSPARRATFLRHLAKYGCLTDAARRTGVSPRTIYRHQDKDEDFARHVALAIDMAAGGIELVAWERAVAGVEEQFACGGKVHTRKRYSESLLRLFLQATDPKKYGPRPGLTRKRLMAWERKRLKKEVEAEVRAKLRPRSFDEVRDSIMRKVEAIRRHSEPAKLAAGWQRDEEGRWIPPGWVRAEGEGRAEIAVPDAETPCDSL